MPVLIDPKIPFFFYSGKSLSMTNYIHTNKRSRYLSQGNVLSRRGHPFNAWYSALFGRFRIRLKGEECFTSITEAQTKNTVPDYFASGSVELLQL